AADGAVDWLGRERGRGVLPALGGGLLEARSLEQRWATLCRVRDELGEPWQQPLEWMGWQGTVEGRGETLVRVQCGRESIGERLSLWLDLLLVSAVAPSRRPMRAVLISRADRQAFRITTTLSAPPPKTAADELERLEALREAWLERCWPVPLRTGWAWLEAEQRRVGSGLQAAAETWEGTPQLRGERLQEEMEVCFGAQFAAAELIQEPFPTCARELLLPFRAAIESGRTSRRTSP
ncbi:MAG: exonuclease V subunit gamma, partial [Cyanobium sp.]